MRCFSSALVLLAIIPSLSRGAEPIPSAARPKLAPALSDEQKQEKNSLLDKKLVELKRIQEEIRHLRDELNEQQQVGLDLQVYEINQTKLRNLGFDWNAMIDSGPNGPRKAEAGFFNALARNKLAKVFADRNKQTPIGVPATFMFDDGTKTGLSFDCTPTVLDDGRIRLKVQYQISRLAEGGVEHSVRAGETTIEVEPESSYPIVGNSIKQTKANGDKEEVGFVFVIKPYLPKR